MWYERKVMSSQVNEIRIRWIKHLIDSTEILGKSLKIEKAKKQNTAALE